jgi:hypothetical protein
VRLAHQYAVGEDSQYGVPVTVDLSALFSFPIKNVKEVSLTTNRDIGGMLDDARMSIWNSFIILFYLFFLYYIISFNLFYLSISIFLFLFIISCCFSI